MLRTAATAAFVSALWLFATGTGVALPSENTAPRARPANTSAPLADTLLLEKFPDAYAAYSLRRLRPAYDGPVVRVRRASDGAEQDIGFAESGWVDTGAIEDFVDGGDGHVTTWYAQVEGTPNLTQQYASAQPLIARNGSAELDEKGKPTLYFQNSDAKLVTDRFDREINGNDYAIFGVIHHFDYQGETNGFGLEAGAENVEYRFGQTRVNGGFVRINHERLDIGYEKRALISLKNDGDEATLWSGNKMGGSLTKEEDDDLDQSNPTDRVNVGGGFVGTFGEFVVYDAAKSSDEIVEVYRNVTADWEVGPIEWHEEALLPQEFGYQVSLYNWLETLTETDVTLPDGTISWDGTYASTDVLADLWLQVEGLSASSVTRGESAWYVLDNGNGKGIEATGTVRNNDEPRGNGDYGGNPPRSWSNEPAFLYRLDIPLDGGGQGNPWHQNPALGRRAMVVAIVDMMMHHESMVAGSASGWYDMKGKAMLGWAEAYRWCKDVLPTDVQNAFEEGFRILLDDQIDRGPRAVNTNMDMFALHAYADLYMAANSAQTKERAVQAAKAALFGYTDGALETNHEVFTSDAENGVFSPSGPILEGGQPDVFYMGESIYQLLGALEAVTDRETGDIANDWGWLEEVVKRAQDWRTYQMFYDPKRNSPAVGGLNGNSVITAGAGFSGRTSYGVPHGQAGAEWKSVSIGDRFADHAFKANDLPDPTTMAENINSKLSYIDGEMSSVYTGTPEDWNGWSPWTKSTPYLPPKGWYSRLKGMKDSGDPRFEAPPAERDGNTWNKAFGGPPTGREFWSYKDVGPDGKAFGFFVEAMPRQGGYGGWYGGKIETFWTEETGVLLINRHGKTGCDDGAEDSTCFSNLDKKAGHHVWGRDENGNGFTTLLLRGRGLSRTSTFNTDASPPTVTVNNVFNDPSLSPTTEQSGEQTGSEIQGSFEVENTFAVQPNGLKVTHTLASNQADQVTELWASLPVYLRHSNPLRVGDEYHSNIDDTTIEYYDGTNWRAMPEDTDGDGVPEMVTTDALRLGRDYEDGVGPRYGYVSFPNSQDVRLSVSTYYDPYQSMTGVRTVHVDLHGNPGTAKTLPASKGVSYTLQTSDPTQGGGPSTGQVIPLQKGWNIASASVSPTAPAMDSVFAGVESAVTVVENEAGEQYRPGAGVNEIGAWNAEEAYLIHATASVTLTVEGDPVGSPALSLEQGWNWVPYFPAAPLGVQEAISSIAGDLVLLKDEAGRAYAPDESVEVLEQLVPGKGYKVYVQQPTTLEYPEN